MSVPLPETYGATASAAPVSSSSFGIPVTSTGSENSTVRSKLPALYLPSAAVDVAFTTTASLPMSITYTAPRDSLPVAPTAKSCAPSRFRSPASAADAPNFSPALSAAPGRLALLTATVRFTDPSELRRITYASPGGAVSPALRGSSPGAPAKMSGVPSRSTSPAAETAPKSPSRPAPGPLAVEPLISAVLFTVPSELRNIMWTAPLFVDAPPAPSSISAPAATSGTPSPSRSPTPASEEPNPSPSESEGPFAVDELISAVLFTVPSAFMNSRCTAPLPLPPASSPWAPAATSGTPSRSRSPTPASDEPNRSTFPSCRLRAVSELISAVLFAVPSELRNIMWTAPLLNPPASSLGAPAATSGTPSRSRSPTPASDDPNRSKSASCGPLGVRASILAMRSTVPSGSMNITYTAPRLRVRPSSTSSSDRAPAARSGTPSPSMSPMPATPLPKASMSSSGGPFLTVSSNVAAPFTVPSGFISSTWTAPELLPASAEPASWFSAPAAMSGTPSPSKSPMPATEEPNESASDMPGPLGVAELISAVPFTVPSELRNRTCTAPLPPPPASSPGAPAATSVTPSPSRSPSAAADWPKKSPFESDGPFAVDESISAVLFTVPSRFMNRT